MSDLRFTALFLSQTYTQQGAHTPWIGEGSLQKWTLFVWKGNLAEQNCRLNSKTEKREWRGESDDRRGKQRVIKENQRCVFKGWEQELRVRPPPNATQQEHRASRWLSTTRRSWQIASLKLLPVSKNGWAGWLFGAPGMRYFYFWGCLSRRIIQRLLQYHLAYSGGHIRSQVPAWLHSK